MENLNEYEKQRLENIRRNQEKLKELNLLSASLLFEDLKGNKTKKRKRKYEKRLKEVRPDFKRITRNQAKELKFNIENKDDIKKHEVEIELNMEEEELLLSAEDYFSEEIKKKAIVVDGHFNGWINPDLIEKYHFEKSAKEAWDKNGGGVYSHKNPLGEFKEVSKVVKPRNWSSAKYTALKLFQKNPNAYFYRHLEPGLTQNIGDWDDNEKENFLKIAKKYGCGDKWGIFSSYIPNRQVIIQEGLIFDPNYKFSKWGKPIYCGFHSKNKKKDNENKQSLSNNNEKLSSKTDDNEILTVKNNRFQSNNRSLKQNNQQNNNQVSKQNYEESNHFNNNKDDQIMTNNDNTKINNRKKYNKDLSEKNKEVIIIDDIDDIENKNPKNNRYSLRKRKPIFYK
ncbi:hypothetical protein U3516DRAFT_784771 [Neocallimastix sp. 'constans']